MNYQKIYNNLILKAKSLNRKRFKRNHPNYQYFEQHHIFPKCMGGTDIRENLVLMTPEEHYVAHQLLVKIYPNESKLVCAVIKMTKGKENIKRKRNNKLYGWLKRKRSQNMKGNKLGFRIPKPGSKTVLCIELNISFKTFKEAADYVGLKNPYDVVDSCNGKRPHAGGYHWKFLEDSDSPINIKGNPTILKRQNFKKVLCVETGEIFNTAKEATKKYGGSVDAAARGTQKTSAGYHWKYI